MKLPKKKTVSEWNDLMGKEIENFAHRHLEFQEVMEHVLEHTTTDIDPELHLLKNFHYLQYIYHYYLSIVTDPNVGIPSEVVDVFVENAVNLAETALDDNFGTRGKSIKQEYLDPEDRVTQKGGDA